MYELSLVFLTYNARPGDVRESLESVICQKDVELEIVIADDGSKDNLKVKIESFFEEKSFTDYKLVLNPQNAGTVANLLSGLEAAEGEYTKTLSPGDRLCSEYAMRKWLDFMKLRDLTWSFSDAVYYHKDERGVDVVFSGEAAPQDLTPYIRKNENRCRWNYAVLGDIPVGATLLSKTDIQTAYCRRIREAGVKYAEDNMWRLMMFEGITGTYYPEQTVMYECGSGISASVSDVWKKRIADDWKTVNDMMCGIKEPDRLQQAMLEGIREDSSILRKLLVKGKLKLKLKRRFRKRMTRCR